jgi:hypothetical protein
MRAMQFLLRPDLSLCASDECGRYTAAVSGITRRIESTSSQVSCSLASTSVWLVVWCEMLTGGSCDWVSLQPVMGPVVEH